MARTAPVVDHWRHFADFCRYEIAAGGPDPHMAYGAWLARGEPEAEQWWRAGLHAVGVYNIAGAEVIWQHWPWAAARAHPDLLGQWITDHWAGIPFRRERRAVRTPAKLTRCLLSYLAWMDRQDFVPRGRPAALYEAMWADVTKNVYGAGRYATFKLLEALRSWAGWPVDLPDLRERGGWSPRTTLAWLLPDFPGADEPHRDDPSSLAWAAHAGEVARDRLASAYGVSLSRYQFSVFLCDYKQSYEGRAAYPGRAADSQADYAFKVQQWWGTRYDPQVWLARAATAPPWSLGEVAGWAGVRKPLGSVLADHRYTWTDSLYCWAASQDDLAHPVRWPRPLSSAP